MNDRAYFENMRRELRDDLGNGKIYHQLFQNAQNEITSNKGVSLISLGETIMSIIENTESAKKLRNKVLKYEKGHSDIPTYLNKAQLFWEKRILKSLNTMCTELNIPLAKKRTPTETQEIKRCWNELGTQITDLSKFRPVYAPKDFLEVVLAIKCTNLTDLALQSILGLIQAPINIKNYSQIRAEFVQLSPDFTHYGLIDGPNHILELERFKTGQKVIEVNDLLLTRQYCKQGCSTSQRGKLWAEMLNVDIDELDVYYYNYLKQSVIDYDLLIDSLYYKDVKLTAVNDDQVFVFEDFLYQILLLFSRDTHVLKCFERNGGKAPKSTLKGKQNITITYPPNGVIPFHGFSMLVAPICFVYCDQILLYYIFREFYMTHFHKLNIISSDPQGIVGLCLLFENLLQTKDPQLFFHLRKIQAQPLKFAFKWIMRAFSGFLSSSQLLELWDRVLAFNSLEILSIFAVGVFLYRKHNLMLVTNDANVEAIFADLTSLKVVCVLQLLLL